MEERDPDFARKAVEIIELELHPPTDGPTFCVDEKTGIGVRRPAAPSQPVAPGRLADAVRPDDPPDPRPGLPAPLGRGRRLAGLPPLAPVRLPLAADPRLLALLRRGLVRHPQQEMPQA